LPPVRLVSGVCTVSANICLCTVPFQPSHPRERDKYNWTLLRIESLKGQKEKRRRWRSRGKRVN